jgi:hypothetical protein
MREIYFYLSAKELLIMPKADTLPAGAELIGNLQVSQDLGIRFQEPNGVAYLDAPLHVFRTRQPGGDRFDVRVEHQPLDSAQLFGFLREVAPNKRPLNSMYGVLADWRIVDQAEREKAVMPGGSSTYMLIWEMGGQSF